MVRKQLLIKKIGEWSLIEDIEYPSLAFGIFCGLLLVLVIFLFHEGLHYIRDLVCEAKQCHTS